MEGFLLMFKTLINMMDALVITIRFCFGPTEVGSDCQMFFYELQHDKFNGKFFFTQYEGSDE